MRRRRRGFGSGDPGTCGGLHIHRLQEAVREHGVQAHHVAGVLGQPGPQQAEGLPGQTEVLALGRVLQVRELKDKALKVLVGRGAPGHIEAVPCDVRDGEGERPRGELLCRDDTRQPRRGSENTQWITDRNHD